MRALSAADLLAIWEEGVQRGAAEQALLLLRCAFPETPAQELAGLSAGRVNALLLALRAQTFGEQLEAYVECPACHERLEIPLSTTQLLASAPECLAGQPPAATLDADGVLLRLRLPTLRDIDAAVAGWGYADALKALLQCCVHAERDGRPLDPAALPETVIEQIDAWMAAQDPLSVLTLALRCPACSHFWQAILDIAAYFFGEVAAQAKRLMREVHALAKQYGWSEAHILTMSAIRRQAYLELGEGQ